MENNIKLLEVEVNKLSLKLGDVLLAKVSGPDFDEETVQALKMSLKKVLPNNPVGVLCMQDNTIDFTIISPEDAQVIESILEKNQPKENDSSCNNPKKCLNCKCDTKDFVETAKEVMDRHSDLIEKLAESEQKDKEQQENQ